MQQALADTAVSVRFQEPAGLGTSSMVKKLSAVLLAACRISPVSPAPREPPVLFQHQACLAHGCGMKHDQRQHEPGREDSLTSVSSVSSTRPCLEGKWQSRLRS